MQKLDSSFKIASKKMLDIDGYDKVEVVALDPEVYPQGGPLWTHIRRYCIINGSRIPDMFGVGYDCLGELFSSACISPGSFNARENAKTVYTKRAMEYGAKHEHSANLLFITKLPMGYTLKPATIHLMNIPGLTKAAHHERRITLGDTPDGLVYDNKGRLHGVLETKCPYSSGARFMLWPKVQWMLQTILHMLVTGVEYGYINMYYPNSGGYSDTPPQSTVWKMYIPRNSIIYVRMLKVIEVFLRIVQKNKSRETWETEYRLETLGTVTDMLTALAISPTMGGRLANLVGLGKVDNWCDAGSPGPCVEQISLIPRVDGKVLKRKVVNI